MTGPGQHSKPEGRIRRSWRLTNAAWDLVRRDRTLLALALMGIGFATAAAFLIFYLSGYVQHPDRGRGHLAVVAFLALYPSTLVSVFFNVALARAASEALDGRSISLREALATSLRRLDQIALWSLISVVVGLLLEQIASRLPLGGRIASSIVGAAWALATIFVVPILALEGRGATQAIRRSSHLLRERWGEGLAGNLTIGFWVGIVTIPVVFVFCIALGLTKPYPAAAGAVVIVDLVVLVLISAVAAALRQVFAVVLYRYATAGVSGGFSAEDLEGPFAERKRASTSTNRRWIAYALAAVSALIVMVVLLVPNHQRYWSGPGYWHAHFPQGAELHDGMPVVIKDRRIGQVVDHYPIEGEEENVIFHVDPRYDAKLDRGFNLLVDGPPGDTYIRIKFTPGR